MSELSTPSHISRLLLIVVALLGASGVGIGAYAAHGLGVALEKQGVVAEDIDKRVQQAETGVRYQMFHTLALLAIALTGLTRKSKFALGAALLMIIGVLLFSVSLYIIAIAGTNLHKVVPFGGVAYILGWLVLGSCALTVRATR